MTAADGVAVRRSRALSPDPDAWGLEERAIMVVLSHLAFLTLGLVIVTTLYENVKGARSAVLWRFVGYEAIMIVTVGFALVATETVINQTRGAFTRAFPRVKRVASPIDSTSPGIPQLRVVRWIALWIGITSGFLAAGVLIVASGGLTSSIFAQLPFTMVILGALMSNDRWTAIGVFVYGALYAVLLLYSPDWLLEFLFGTATLGQPTNVKLLALLITCLNASIGVSATYLSRPTSSPPSDQTPEPEVAKEAPGEPANDQMGLRTPEVSADGSGPDA